MPVPQPYIAVELTQAELEQRVAPCVLDFGTNWCGFCQAAQPLVDAALALHPQLAHVKIEDGKGRALGRSFKVTLWPTLIFMRHGREVARLVRPADSTSVLQALAQLAD